MKRFINKRNLALVICAALLSGILLSGNIWLKGTYADQEDYSVAFNDPYLTGYVSITVGTQAVTARVSNAYRWANSNDAVLELAADKAVGKYTADIEGLKAGATVISVGTTTGQVTYLQYKVVDPANVASYTVTGGLVGYLNNINDKLTIPVKTNPPEAVDRIKWSSTDEAVATVSGREVTAKVGNGAAVLTGTLTDPWGVEHTIPFAVVIGKGVNSGSGSGAVAFNDPYPTGYVSITAGTKAVTPRVSNAYRWANSNDAVLKLDAANAVGKYTADIEGLKAGATVISVGTTTGQVTYLQYKVVDPANASSYSISGGYVGYIANKNGTLNIPISTNPFGAAQKITTVSANPSVATINRGTVTAQVDNGAAMILGAVTDQWGVEHTIPFLVIIGSGGGGDLIKGDDNNWYRPVGRPPHVFEKVDKDGKPSQPPEYVYNPGDKPGDGSDKPAVPGGNGNFWVEDDPGNIWVPIDNDDGSLDYGNAVWGGPDGKPGGGDDESASKFGGKWWVNKGQNVWREVTKKDTFGPLTGGGPNKNPAETGDKGRPIDENNGKYYLAAGKDADGNDIWYGDPAAGGNGTLDSTRDGLAGDDVIYYKDADGNMTTTKPGGDLVKGPDGNWYKPVGKPPNVYEKVDKDGKPSQPPEYVYNPNGKPGDGNDKPAMPDGGGGFWVQVDPPGNVWIKVDDNGALDNNNTVWGGPDGKPGGGDDEKAYEDTNGTYWVHRGQNVWQQVLPEAPRTLGPLTGGGPVGSPAATGVKGRPIYENKGKYYLTAGKDADGNDIWYGDPAAGGNGKLDSTQDGLAGDDVIYYKDADGNMTTTKPVTKVPTNVSVVISPFTATYTLGGQEPKFTAYVAGDNLVNGTGNNAVIWSVDKNGASITDGSFTATAAGIYTVTAIAKDDPSKKATATVTVNSSDSDILGGKKDDILVIDGREWIWVRNDSVQGPNYVLLMLKDTIGTWAYDSLHGYNSDYLSSDISISVRDWYNNLNSPTLKAMARQAQTGRTPNESWPDLSDKGSGVYAFLPRVADIENLSFSSLVIGKDYWTTTETTYIGAVGYQSIVSATGNPSVYSARAVEQIIYARPVIWVYIP